MLPEFLQGWPVALDEGHNLARELRIHAPHTRLSRTDQDPAVLSIDFDANLRAFCQPEWF
jgi:hypothetical protein